MVRNKWSWIRPNSVKNNTKEKENLFFCEIDLQVFRNGRDIIEEKKNAIYDVNARSGEKLDEICVYFYYRWPSTCNTEKSCFLPFHIVHIRLGYLGNWNKIILEIQNFSSFQELWGKIYSSQFIDDFYVFSVKIDKLE